MNILVNIKREIVNKQVEVFNVINVYEKYGAKSIETYKTIYEHILKEKIQDFVVTQLNNRYTIEFDISKNTDQLNLFLIFSIFDVWFEETGENLHVRLNTRSLPTNIGQAEDIVNYYYPSIKKEIAFTLAVKFFFGYRKDSHSVVKKGEELFGKYWEEEVGNTWGDWLFCYDTPIKFRLEIK